MEVRDWKPAILACNKFEGQLLAGLLRNAGAPESFMLNDTASAIEALRFRRVNMVFVAVAAEDVALDWVRSLRRSVGVPVRQGPVLIVSNRLTAAQAERFRHAGASAIVGKPISATVLVTVAKKVLTKPRPFIEGENYVGPCRRAGIVTAGMEKRRRQSDTSAISRPPFERGTRS